MMPLIDGQGAITLLFPAEQSGIVRSLYRPSADVTTLIVRQPPDQVPGLVRRLFAICAEAQGHAASLAIAAAQGATCSDAELAHGEARVAAETCREHALRISFDWTSVLGEPKDADLARSFVDATRGGDAAQIAAVSQAGVFATDQAEWLAMDSASDLARWASAGQTAAARFIARLFDTHTLVPLGDTQPMGLAARHGDHPLLAHALAPGSLMAAHVARLIDLARTGQRIADLQAGRVAAWRAVSPAVGRGLAQVACARGILRHEVTLKGGTICAYRISSPTERSFAAGGVAERQLRALPALPKAPRLALANLVMQALDPCVPYTIEVS